MEERRLHTFPPIIFFKKEHRLCTIVTNLHQEVPANVRKPFSIPWKQLLYQTINYTCKHWPKIAEDLIRFFKFDLGRAVWSSTLLSDHPVYDTQHQEPIDTRFHTPFITWHFIQHWSCVQSQNPSTAQVHHRWWDYGWECDPEASWRLA